MELIWGCVIIGGPVLLGAALVWAKLRAGKANKNMDPSTPSDDPSKGMTGHG